MNPETSDPNDPETNTWWIWIPVLVTCFFLFATIVFERDFLFDARLNSATVSSQIDG